MSKESLSVGVARLSLGFTLDKPAFEQLQHIKQKSEVDLGVEVLPHRLSTSWGYRKLKKKFGIEVRGIHGPVYAKQLEFLVAAHQRLQNDPPDRTDAALQLVWLMGFGALDEPKYAKLHGSSMKLAEEMQAYLLLHHEAVKSMSNELLEQYHGLPILQENGWGPSDGTHNPFSWDPRAIRDYADKRGIGTALDVSTAAREENVSIMDAYKIMKPHVIHFSGYDPDKGENLIPQEGRHMGELRELVQQVSRDEGVMLMIEVWKNPTPYDSIMHTLDFIDDAGGGVL